MRICLWICLAFHGIFDRLKKFLIMKTSVAQKVLIVSFLLTAAFRNDAAILRWGYDANAYLQSQIPEDLTNVQAIAAGSFFSLALRTDGTVMGWGNSGYGQLDIPIVLSNVTAIAAGGFHGLARRSDGTVVAWGAGGFGQSGSYDHGQSIVPVGLSKLVAGVAGAWRSLAVNATGT